MSIDPRSLFPQFDPGHKDGIVEVAMNVAAGHSLSGHLRAAIEHQKRLGRYVPDCLIAYAEKLAAAAFQAAGVLAGEEQPTDPKTIEKVEPSPAPYFSTSVADDGFIDVDATTKMAHILSTTLWEYRTWRHDQGLALPGEISAFGAAMRNLARVARPAAPERPVVRLPEERAGSPLGRFLKPGAC